MGEVPPGLRVQGFDLEVSCGWPRLETTRRHDDIVRAYNPLGPYSKPMIYGGAGFRVYRGTLPIRKRTTQGPYRRPMPRVLGGS
jgi:hypothetical protein